MFHIMMFVGCNFYVFAAILRQASSTLTMETHIFSNFFLLLNKISKTTIHHSHGVLGFWGFGVYVLVLHICNLLFLNYRYC